MNLRRWRGTAGAEVVEEEDEASEEVEVVEEGVSGRVPTPWAVVEEDTRADGDLPSLLTFSFSIPVYDPY